MTRGTANRVLSALRLREDGHWVWSAITTPDFPHALVEFIAFLELEACPVGDHKYADRFMDRESTVPRAIVIALVTTRTMNEPGIIDAASLCYHSPEDLAPGKW